MERCESSTLETLQRYDDRQADFFKATFDQAATGMALVSVEGRCLLVNQSLCDFLGRTQEELRDTDYRQITVPEDQAKSISLFEQLAAGTIDRYELEKRYLHKNGSPVWAMVTVSRLRPPDSCTSYIHVQVHDIAKRKDAEDALRRSEALFRAISENADDVITLTDRQHLIVYASPAHTRVLGYSVAEREGADFLSLIHPQDRAQAAHDLQQMLESGRYAGTLRLSHKDGHARHVEINGTAIRTPAGEVESCLFVARPIDDRLRAEQELRSSHRASELFINAVPSILIGTDSAGNITRWNVAAANTFGLSDSEVRGKLFSKCGIQWLRPDMEEEIHTWLKVEKYKRCDNLGFKRREETRFLGLTVLRVSDRLGELPGFVITGADITERKALEDQLRQAQKLEAIGQLAAGIAHEINTPTQYVGDNTTFLKESWSSISELISISREIVEGKGNEGAASELISRYRECANRVDLDFLEAEIPRALNQSLEGIQRVSKIVRAMKEFSHPGSDERAPLNINHAIETTITVARNEWKYVAEIEKRLDPTLPEVFCFVGEFNQAVLNLLVNAAQAIAPVVKATPGSKGKIEVMTRRDGEWAEISIRDTGTGIPDAIRGRIFEPFFTTKEVGQGTGQGLALAHAVIVKKHGGKIWFESKQGVGTTFFIRVPLGPATDAK